MATSLSLYLADAVRRDRSVDDSLEKCQTCGDGLQEAIKGYRRVGTGAQCSDCYYNAFGEMIDKHPIGRPMSRVSGA